MSIRLIVSIVTRAALLAGFTVVTTAGVCEPYHGETFDAGESDAPWDSRFTIKMSGYTYEPNELISISQNVRPQTSYWRFLQQVRSSTQGTEIYGGTYYYWTADVWAYDHADWSRSGLCEDNSPRYVTWLRADRNLGYGGLQGLPTFLKNADQCADTVEDMEEFLDRCPSPFSPMVKVYYCDQSNL